jgi:hypothetical protein
MDALTQPSANSVSGFSLHGPYDNRAQAEYEAAYRASIAQNMNSSGIPSFPPGLQPASHRLSFPSLIQPSLAPSQQLSTTASINSAATSSFSSSSSVPPPVAIVPSWAEIMRDSSFSSVPNDDDNLTTALNELSILSHSIPSPSSSRITPSTNPPPLIPLSIPGYGPPSMIPVSGFPVNSVGIKSSIASSPLSTSSQTFISQSSAHIIPNSHSVNMGGGGANDIQMPSAVVPCSPGNVGYLALDPGTVQWSSGQSFPYPYPSPTIPPTLNMSADTNSSPYGGQMMDPATMAFYQYQQLAYVQMYQQQQQLAYVQKCQQQQQQLAAMYSAASVNRGFSGGVEIGTGGRDGTAGAPGRAGGRDTGRGRGRGFNGPVGMNSQQQAAAYSQYYSEYKQYYAAYAAAIQQQQHQPQLPSQMPQVPPNAIHYPVDGGYWAFNPSTMQWSSSQNPRHHQHSQHSQHSPTVGNSIYLTPQQASIMMDQQQRNMRQAQVHPSGRESGRGGGAAPDGMKRNEN